MRAFKFKLHCVALGAAILGFSMIATAQAQGLTGTALIGALRQGGYVIVMRHTSSPREIPSKAVANPDNVTPERQLDETGRTTARAMGVAVKALGIPLGDVLSSPTYRAREMLKIAGLTKYKTVPELDEPASGMSMAGPGSSKSGAWLKAKAAEPPRAGTDTLIVSHVPNIVGAFTPEVKSLADGEALVLRPDGKGAAAIVAHIKIEEWPQLASMAASHNY